MHHIKQGEYIKMKKTNKLTNLTSIALIISIVFVFTGCKTVNLTSMQKRQITSRVVDGNYDNIFKSTMTILQDNEYIIKETNKDTGLISAEVNREANIWTKALSTNKYGVSSSAGTKVEISATVDKLNNDSSEVRLTIQEKTYSSNGGTTKVVPNYDVKTYATLFNSLKTEVKRREAFGR
jgi:hypothetical protein